MKNLLSRSLNTFSQHIQNIAAKENLEVQKNLSVRLITAKPDSRLLFAKLHKFSIGWTLQHKN